MAPIPCTEETTIPRVQFRVPGKGQSLGQRRELELLSLRVERNYNYAQKLTVLWGWRNGVDQRRKYERVLLAGEQLLRTGRKRRGLRLRRALSGRTGRVDYREPPSHLTSS